MIQNKRILGDVLSRKIASHLTCDRHLVSSPHMTALDKTIKCSITFYFVYTTLPNYKYNDNIITPLLEISTPSMKYIESSSGFVVLFSILRRTKGNQDMCGSEERTTSFNPSQSSLHSMHTLTRLIFHCISYSIDLL